MKGTYILLLYAPDPHVAIHLATEAHKEFSKCTDQQAIFGPLHRECFEGE